MEKKKQHVCRKYAWELPCACFLKRDGTILVFALAFDRPEMLAILRSVTWNTNLQATTPNTVNCSMLLCSPSSEVQQREPYGILCGCMTDDSWLHFRHAGFWMLLHHMHEF